MALLTCLLPLLTGCPGQRRSARPCRASGKSLSSSAGVFLRPLPQPPSLSAVWCRHTQPSPGGRGIGAGCLSLLKTSFKAVVWFPQRPSQQFLRRATQGESWEDRLLLTRALLCRLKPGLGTLGGGGGTVFTQGLFSHQGRRVTSVQKWEMWAVWGSLAQGSADSAQIRDSPLTPSFLQGPVGPAGGPGFPGAPGAKVRALVVESGTPFPMSSADCPLDDPLPS